MSEVNKHPMSRTRSPEWRKAHSERMKGNKFAVGNKSHSGQNLVWSKEHKENVLKHINSLNEKGFQNKGGKCKFYKVGDNIVQGRYELYYLLINPHLNSNVKRIKTPFGFYTPDFYDGDKYIEIKSKYTIKTSMRNGQFKKIMWVNKNILKVSIEILDEKLVKSYFSNVNLDNFKYVTR